MGLVRVSVKVIRVVGVRVEVDGFFVELRPIYELRPTYYSSVEL